MPRFIVADVKPAQYIPEIVEAPVSYLKSLKAVTKNNGALLKFTAPENAVMPRFGDGFVGAAYMAYNNHHELVIRPDDIWLAILAAMAGYVDAHAEEMREVFVKHSGKERISIQVVDSSSVKDVDWARLVTSFGDEIGKRTISGVLEWAEPGFTTSTAKDRVIGRIMLMGAMKNYFEYRASMCACGLPSVSLEGTLADWLDVRARAERIRVYGVSSHQPMLVEWHKVLERVLDKFIQSYQGNVDRKWWNGICEYQGMSGSSDITGWILAFTPFKKGMYRLPRFETIIKDNYYGRLDVGDVESVTCVEAPVTLVDGNGEIEGVFCAGSIFSTYDHSTNQMSPAWDYVIIHKDAVNAPAWARPVEDVPLPVNTFQYKVHAHPLTHTAGLRGHRCDMCSITGIRESFRCKACDFDMRISCFRVYYAATNPAADAETCTSPAHDHPVKRVFGLKGRFQCDTCNLQKLQSSYRCVACDFDICCDCIDKGVDKSMLWRVELARQPQVCPRLQPDSGDLSTAQSGLVPM